MISKEAAIRNFIEEYDIEVPEEAVEQEIKLVTTDIRHRMTYAGMDGQRRMNPLEQQAELENMQDEIKEIAYYNIKEELVMKELMQRDDFAVSSEELLEYAEKMAKEQNTTLEFIKRFFGEDLSMLESDIRRHKVENMIYEQAKA